MINVEKMSKENKAILLKDNQSISEGDHEGFLALCTEDTLWEFVGEQILKGKAAVREYMAENYIVPPKFHVSKLIAENEFVTAMGEIELKEQDGNWKKYSYCDLWRFWDGKMAELKAYVIAQKTGADNF